MTPGLARLAGAIRLARLAGYDLQETGASCKLSTGIQNGTEG
jgi:hypothetical protein